MANADASEVTAVPALTQVQQFAAHYIRNMKFQVVPLAPQSKACYDDDWTDKIYGVHNFSPAANLGLRSTGGLVILDDDFPKPAVKCADALLPPTGAIYGRPTNLRSKRLYRCPELTETVTFKDVDKAHRVQLRVGQQDMAPPSIHPDTKERVQWDGLLLPPLAITREDLVTRARYYYTARLLAQYWPAHGRRELRLALARVLLVTLGLADDVATTILEWACELGGSDDHGIRHAAKAITDTRTRLNEHKPVMGAKSVAKLLPDTGARLVKVLREAYGKTDAADMAVEELNEHTALVWQQSGSLVVLTEDMEDGQPHLRFSRPADLPLIYPRLIRVGTKKGGDPIVQAQGALWLRHPQRRFYRGLEVAPHRDRGNADYYNLWRGFSVEPRQGKWPLFQEHLRLVANYNEQHAVYILSWMALTVQHPERPIGIALAFKGLQGTGKSTFAKWFGRLFGGHFLHLDSEQRLLGQFNAHLHNAIVVLADEAVWAGSKAGLGALKRMITEDTLNIERKHVDVLTVKNMIHMIVASNEKWVVPAGFDNRRFAIFGTSTKKQNDKQFFASVHEELFKRGGLSALLYDLLNVKVTLDLTKIPETADLVEQKVLSADFEEKFWIEKLRQGYLRVVQSLDERHQPKGEKSYEWPSTMPKDELHEEYLRFLDQHHRSNRNPRATETELGRFLKNRTLLTDRRSLIEGERQRYWTVPPLPVCREHWVRECHWPADFQWD